MSLLIKTEEGCKGGFEFQLLKIYVKITNDGRYMVHYSTINHTFNFVSIYSDKN